jgi:hypothetical protein
MLIKSLLLECNVGNLLIEKPFYKKTIRQFYLLCQAKSACRMLCPEIANIRREGHRDSGSAEFVSSTGRGGKQKYPSWGGSRGNG